MKCPKCGREIVGKAHFSNPDCTGVIAMVWHKETKYKTLFGERGIQREERCFLTQDEWDKMIEEEE